MEIETSFLEIFHTFIPWDKPYRDIIEIVKVYNKKQKGK